MKIYQALPTLASKNPYVETLIQEIDQQYEDCVWGYGINGNEPTIPALSPIAFEIELLEQEEVED